MVVWERFCSTAGEGMRTDGTGVLNSAPPGLGMGVCLRRYPALIQEEVVHRLGAELPAYNIRGISNGLAA